MSQCPETPGVQREIPIRVLLSGQGRDETRSGWRVVLVTDRTFCTGFRKVLGHPQRDTPGLGSPRPGEL